MSMEPRYRFGLADWLGVLVVLGCLLLMWAVTR